MTDRIVISAKIIPNDEHTKKKVLDKIESLGEVTEYSIDFKGEKTTKGEDRDVA